MKLTLIVWQNCWVQMTQRATRPSANPSRFSEWEMSLSWLCQIRAASSYVLLSSIFSWKWQNWSSPGKSCWCKSDAGVCAVSQGGGGRRALLPEETGARWGSRMTAEVESMKTRWLSWRGSADRSINIPMTAFKYPIQQLFVFPFHDQTDGVLIFLLMRRPNIDRNNFSCGKYQPKLCWGWCRNHWRKCWWKF